MDEAQGKKVAAPPLRQGDRGAGVLWPDRASMRPRRRVPDGLKGKSCVRGTTQEPGVAGREIANLAHAKAPRIPEPVSTRKMQSPTLFGYRRALSHRPGNSAFSASLTVDIAGHHPTDDEADDSIYDAAFRTICVVRKNLKSEPAAGARPPRATRLCAAVKICLSLGK
jgi:hypothetical protein